MIETKFVPAWRLNDAKLMDDAKTFWTALGLLAGEERERRAAELIAVAYVDGAAAAVSTASIAPLPQFGQRFAMYRCAVGRDYRRHDISYRLSGYSRQVVEEWSAAHPEEGVVGLAAIIQAAEYREKQREPTWPEHDLNLNLVGYTQRGEQIRVSWFKHARLQESRG